MVCHTLRQIMERGIIMFNTCGLESGLNNNNNHDGDDKKELFKQIHFLLCESCFWCASYLSSKSVSVVKCPNCYNNKIEWMPISKVDLDKLTKEDNINKGRRKWRWFEELKEQRVRDIETEMS